jgi:hypothetical protein
VARASFFRKPLRSRVRENLPTRKKIRPVVTPRTARPAAREYDARNSGRDPALTTSALAPEFQPYSQEGNGMFKKSLLMIAVVSVTAIAAGGAAANASPSDPNPVVRDHGFAPVTQDMRLDAESLSGAYGARGVEAADDYVVKTGVWSSVKNAAKKVGGAVKQATKAAGSVIGKGAKAIAKGAKALACKAVPVAKRILPPVKVCPR